MKARRKRWTVADDREDLRARLLARREREGAELNHYMVLAMKDLDARIMQPFCKQVDAADPLTAIREARAYIEPFLASRVPVRTFDGWCVAKWSGNGWVEPLFWRAGEVDVSRSVNQG